MHLAWARPPSSKLDPSLTNEGNLSKLIFFFCLRFLCYKMKMKIIHISHLILPVASWGNTSPYFIKLWGPKWLLCIKLFWGPKWLEGCLAYVRYKYLLINYLLLPGKVELSCSNSINTVYYSLGPCALSFWHFFIFIFNLRDFNYFKVSVYI